MDVQLIREFSVYLADRPGELAGILEALVSAGAHVTAISVTEQNGRGLVRLLAEPETVVRRVCESVVDSGGGPVAEADVLVVDLGQNPGLFREVAFRLAGRAVNVRYAYQAPAHNGTPSRCILRVDDPEQARRIIGEVV